MWKGALKKIFHRKNHKQIVKFKEELKETRYLVNKKQKSKKNLKVKKKKIFKLNLIKIIFLTNCILIS